MTAPNTEKFRCEINEDPSKRTTHVTCYGRLVSGDTEGLRSAVGPLIVKGGRIVLDMSHVTQVDSMGLGALVSLKISSVHKGFGTLEYANLTPRIKDLLRITHLTEYLARPDTVNYGDQA